MPTPLNVRVSPGQRIESIPAAMFNGWQDAAEFTRQQRVFAANVGSGSGEAGIVRIRNDSGSDVDRFGILGLAGIVFTPDDNADAFKTSPVLKGITPTAAELERFVILQEPVSADQIGRGLLLGISAVEIDVVHEDDDYADVIAGDATKLRSQPYGASWIAYKEAGTGTKWAFVVHGIPGSQFVFGKTAAAIAKGASGTINVYRGNTAFSEAWTSSTTITASNHFGDVASGKWALCCRLQRNFRIIAAEC